jgi:hypothetical protein
MNRLEMRVAVQQIVRTTPEDQHIRRRVGKIAAQFMDQRRGEQRIADAREGDDKDSHSAEISCADEVGKGMTRDETPITK